MHFPFSSLLQLKIFSFVHQDHPVIVRFLSLFCQSPLTANSCRYQSSYNPVLFLADGLQTNPSPLVYWNHTSTGFRARQHTAISIWQSFHPQLPSPPVAPVAPVGLLPPSLPLGCLVMGSALPPPLALLLHPLGPRRPPTIFSVANLKTEGGKYALHF